MTPFLARSVGFFPVFFPPERRLGHAAIETQPGPVDSFPIVVGHQAVFPQRLEDALLNPKLQAVMGSGARAEAGGVQRLPLATRAQDVENGLHTDPVRGGRLTAAEGMGVDALGDQRGNGLPQIIGDAPLVHHPFLVHGSFLGGFSSCQKTKCSCTKRL